MDCSSSSNLKIKSQKLIVEHFLRFISLLIMEDIRFNVDNVLANIEMEIPKINCVSTPSKSQCNDNKLNVFNGLTNSKVVSQHNDSHIEKIESYIKEKFDEVATNHLKQKILADLKEQYQTSTTYHLDSSVINSLKDHIKSLESEIQFLRKEIKEKNTLISSLIPSKIIESKHCEANKLKISNSRTSYLQERETESTASGNALGKNVKEVFVEKTKITDIVETQSQYNIKDDMKPSLRENPDHFVLHIGTNDLNSDRSPELIAKSITDVGSSLKNDSHDVSISSIVVRNDKFKEKAAQVNENLERLCA